MMKDNRCFIILDDDGKMKNSSNRSISQGNWVYEEELLDFKLEQHLFD